MIANLYDSIEGRRHDCTLVKKRVNGQVRCLEILLIPLGDIYKVHLVECNFTTDDFNKSLSQVSVIAGLVFGITYFK